MNYRNDKYGNKLSVLGYGCMRFPRKNGRIDMAKTEQLICRAVEAGINYFDTAYIYPGSEAAVGEILEKKGLRQQVNIATKLPHYLIKSREALDKLFEEELRRLRTDHVDYYLMHMLNDIEAWNRSPGKRPAEPSARWAFRIMAIRRCSAKFWMPMTGSSARCSITIWMSTARQAAGAWPTLRKKASRW